MENLFAYLRVRYLLSLRWPQGIAWPASSRDEVLGLSMPDVPIQPMAPVYDE